MARAIKLQMVRDDFPTLLDTLRIKRAVEIGVFHGEFSYQLLRYSQLDLLISVDSWRGKFESAMLDAAAMLGEFGGRSRLLQRTSTEAAELLSGEQGHFGFIYIDAHHGEKSVRQDIAAWLPLLSRPGIIGGHDYVKVGKCGVVPAVQEAADQLGVPVYLTREEWASWFMILGEDD